MRRNKAPVQSSDTMMPALPRDEQEFTSLAIDQQDAAHGHQEIHDGEEYVAPVSLNIGEAALQEDVSVVADDRIHAGGLVAGEDHAGEDEGNYIFPAEKRFLHSRSG